MKRALYILLLLLLLSATGCKEQPIAVVSVNVNPTTIALEVGDTKRLFVTIFPLDATDTVVTWKSADMGVAVVEDGVVTAVGPGSTSVTATAGGVHGTSIVTVKERFVAVEDVRLSRTDITMRVGDTVMVYATVLPENATNPEVVWSSGNKRVATIDDDGKLAAVGAGSCIFTAKAGGKTAVGNVTVEKAHIDVNGVSLTSSKTKIYLNRSSAQLMALIDPYNATEQGLLWSSSDTKVVEVDSEGWLTPIAVGTAIVTVTTKEGGYSANCEVTVENTPIDSVRFSNGSPDPIEVTPGDTYTLDAVVYPLDASDKSLKWRSYNERLATVSDNGKVTFNDGNGTVLIYVETLTTGRFCSQTFSVSVPLKSIEMQSEANLLAGKTLALKPTFIPSNASDKSLVWTSSNAGVASVSESGVVTAIEAGRATITASAKNNPSVKATCTVTVSGSSCSVKINGGEAVSYYTGGLSNLIFGTSVSRLEWVEGTLNRDDLSAISNMIFSLTYIDMSKSRIEVEDGVATLPAIFKSFSKLAYAALPSNTTSIESMAFSGCSALSDISFPSSLKEIGTRAFEKCAFAMVELPTSLEILGSGAFSMNATLESISIGANLSSFGAGAFSACNKLASIVVDGSNRYLKSDGIALTSKDGMTLYAYAGATVGEGDFTAPRVLKYAPNALESIPVKGKLTIPEGVTTLGSYALANTYAVAIELPSTISSVGENVMSQNYKLKSVTIYAETPPEAESDKLFVACSYLSAIYVPESSVAAYKAADHWKAYSTKIKPIQN